MAGLDEKYLVILTKSGAVARTLHKLFEVSGDEHLKSVNYFTDRENHYGIPKIYWDKEFYKVIVTYIPEAKREQYEIWIA